MLTLEELDTSERRNFKNTDYLNQSANTLDSYLKQSARIDSIDNDSLNELERTVHEPQIIPSEEMPIMKKIKDKQANRI